MKLSLNVGNDSMPIHEEVLDDIPVFIIEANKDLQYWSSEALKELLIGAVEVGIECAEMIQSTIGKRAKCTRFIAKSKKRIDSLKNYTFDRQGILNAVFNFVLTSEGKSTLHGFGYCNKFGDKLSGNPEKNYSKIL